MSDIMTPIPFHSLIARMQEEHKTGSVFSVPRAYHKKDDRMQELFGRRLETVIGPAAGPHTQLAQNILASYIAGARFFELKTVQKMDGEELSSCINKPCILAEDEAYNCEWSTELTVADALAEYVKAWFLCKVAAVEYGLGDPDAFQFNISVGYDLAGIKEPKVNDFIDRMKKAGETAVFKECRSYLLSHLTEFTKLTEKDVENISEEIVNSVTVSTLHGCPPQEIEAIASYLITEKHLNTFVKCNPTLLGYEEARSILDGLGYDYIAFTDIHFKGDLQYEDAVPMLTRLKALAESEGLLFGVKLTNTFPVDVKNKELPSEEMYMSGKSLFPLSMAVAQRLTEDFQGQLRISYSGGIDAFQLLPVLRAGIWPVTLATTLLKPGGYLRFIQLCELAEQDKLPAWSGISAKKIAEIRKGISTDPHIRKPVKPLPSRKSDIAVPLIDCYTMPCRDRCPIHQDITSYGKLVREGKYEEALDVILDKNALPFMTGILCTHSCQSACTRTQYESSIQIRENKLIAARHGFDALLPKLHAAETGNKKQVGIIGAGPAGLAAAFYLARAGMEVDVYDQDQHVGGVVRNIIPSFRIDPRDIEKDVALAEAYGARFHTGEKITEIAKFKEEHGFDIVLLAIGAPKESSLPLEKGEIYPALHFLADFKEKDGRLDLGKHVVVVGGGNTAMDTARAAKRVPGVTDVTLVYRRTKRYMPADEQELEEAIEEGVLFRELQNPLSLENGTLTLSVMELGEMDSSGRRSVRESGRTETLPCDTLIAAIGETVDRAFYEANGISCSEKGMPLLNADSNESSLPGVYVIGDGANGASVIVKAMASAKKACEAILGKEIGTNRASIQTREAVEAKKGVLKDAPEKGEADSRCLTCDRICENCVDVCPNRANFAVHIPGREMPQIIHIDYMCNECGNCKSFCPYRSAPYLDKFTLFAGEADFKDSRNDGFTFLDGSNRVLVRLAGETMNYQVGEENTKLFFRLREIIDTIYHDYSYLMIN